MESNPQAGAVTRKRRRRLVAILLGAALFIAVAPPLVKVNWLKRRLEAAATAELGRKVHLGDISVRALPYPGFDINGVVIADDPAFSAEPMLTAESVTVRLRPSSLWSGRLEFSRFSFDYPSLNLVRDDSGRWNVESLLQHTAATAAAPTGAPRAAAPRFPYIEVSNGRINFKHGTEKLAFTLLDSDLALWLESESQWKVRLETRPTRTDQYLSDTGTLRAEGSFARAPAQALGQVPFQLDADMERGQLGQLTSLTTGFDRGWRGDLRITLKLAGKLDDLSIDSEARVSGVRRYDIDSGPGFRGEFRCGAHLVRTATLLRELRDVQCEVPADNGKLIFSGRFTVPISPDYDVRLQAQDLPVSTIADLYRHAKRSVAADLAAEGIINGDWHFNSTAGASGTGEATGLALSSEKERGSIRIGRLALGFAEQGRGAKRKAPATGLQIGPVSLDFGGGQPVIFSGALGIDTVHLGLRGPAEASRLQSGAAMLGLAATRVDVKGALDLDLALNAAYKDFAPALVTGKVHWKGVEAVVPDTDAVLQSASGTLMLNSTSYTVKPFRAALEKAVIGLEGEITLQRSCDSPPCEAKFTLKAESVDLPMLAARLYPKERPAGWLALSGQFLGSQTPRAWLVDRRASGTFAVQKLTSGPLSASNLAGQFEITERKLSFSSIEGAVLGGRYKGRWNVDFTGDPPEITTESSIEAVSAAALAPWLKSNHATGNISGELRLRMTGASKEAIARSAEGELAFTWKSGSLSRVSLDQGTLRFTSLMGKARIKDSYSSVQDAELRTPRMTYKMNGGLFFDGTLDMKLISPSSEYSVKGTLDSPSVGSNAATTRVASEAGPAQSKSKK